MAAKKHKPRKSHGYVCMTTDELSFFGYKKIGNGVAKYAANGVRVYQCIYCNRWSTYNLNGFCYQCTCEGRYDEVRRKNENEKYKKEYMEFCRSLPPGLDEFEKQRAFSIHVLELSLGKK